MDAYDLDWPQRIETRIENIYNNQIKFTENMVTNVQCNFNRSQCGNDHCSKFQELFDRMTATESVVNEYIAMRDVFVRDSTLARAEGSVLDRAREEDGVVLSKIESRVGKIEDKVKSIDDKLVIFSFSACTLKWMWKNKKGVVALFTFLSVWLYAIDYIVRTL